MSSGGIWDLGDIKVAGERPSTIKRLEAENAQTSLLIKSTQQEYAW